MILGRKGNAGWSNTGAELDRDLVGKGEQKEDGGHGDDKLDRKIEEENGYGHENVARHGEKKDEKTQKRQFEESQSNEGNNSGTQVGGVESMSLTKDGNGEEYSKKGHDSAKESMADDDRKQDEKNPETRVKEPQNAEKNYSSTFTPKIEKKIAEQPVGLVNATVSSLSDMEDGFHDETGVPQEIFEFIRGSAKSQMVIRKR